MKIAEYRNIYWDQYWQKQRFLEYYHQIVNYTYYSGTGARGWNAPNLRMAEDNGEPIWQFQRFYPIPKGAKKEYPHAVGNRVFILFDEAWEQIAGEGHKPIEELTKSGKLYYLVDNHRIHYNLNKPSIDIIKAWSGIRRTPITAHQLSGMLMEDLL